MNRIFRSNVAQEIPFNPAGTGYPSTINTVHKALVESLHPDPLRTSLVLFDDFDNRMSWSPSTSGVGASASVGGGNDTYASGKHLGVARLLYGTGLPSHASLVQSGTLSTSTVFGNGESHYHTLIYIPSLATATEDYVLRLGMGTSTNLDHADGIYFEYDRSQSANWRIKTATNSTRTTTTTSTAVQAGVWIPLKFEVNEDGTNVDFYVNEVLVGSITTNIPVTTGRGCGPNFQLVASAIVSGAKDVLIDYFFFIKRFTSRD